MGCTSTATIDVINWNTYHLFDHQKHKVEATRWLAEQAPSIAALQEVLHLNEAQWQELARSWGHEHAVMHKESGYPVALSSTEPITVVERRTEGFHHGYLHARTHGIDLLVVHFWPGKIHEPEHVAKLAAKLVAEGRPVLVLGDFNGVIRHDEAYLQEHGHLGTVEEGNRTFDYRITDAFLNAGFVDLTNLYSPEAKYTFGSPALIPQWRESMDDVYKTRRRIDYIFAGGTLADRVLASDVVTEDESVGQWSDHFPLRVQISNGR